MTDINTLAHLSSPPPLQRTEEVKGTVWLEMFGNCDSKNCDRLAVGRFYIKTASKWINACNRHWNLMLMACEQCEEPTDD